MEGQNPAVKQGDKGSELVRLPPGQLASWVLCDPERVASPLCPCPCPAALKWKHTRDSGLRLGKTRYLLMTDVVSTLGRRDAPGLCGTRAQGRREGDLAQEPRPGRPSARGRA